MRVPRRDSAFIRSSRTSATQIGTMEIAKVEDRGTVANSLTRASVGRPACVAENARRAAPARQAAGRRRRPERSAVAAAAGALKSSTISSTQRDHFGQSGMPDAAIRRIASSIGMWPMPLPGPPTRRC